MKKRQTKWSCSARNGSVRCVPKTRKKEYKITQPHNKGSLISKAPAKHNVNVFMAAEFDRKLKADSVRVLILELEQDFDINLNSISVIKRNVWVLNKIFHSLLEIIQQLRHNDQIIKDELFLSI